MILRAEDYSNATLNLYNKVIPSKLYGGFEGKPLSDPQDQMIAWAWRD